MLIDDDASFVQQHFVHAVSINGVLNRVCNVLYMFFSKSNSNINGGNSGTIQENIYLLILKKYTVTRSVGVRANFS